MPQGYDELVRLLSGSGGSSVAAANPSAAMLAPSAAPAATPAPAAAASPAPAAASPAPAGGGVAPGPTPASAQLIAPKYNAPDRTALQGAQAKLATDSQPLDAKAIAPKWWERLAGGAAAAGMAFGHVPGAVEAGSAVTTRRADQAHARQDAQVGADKTAIGAEQGKIDAAGTDFENSMKSFKGNVEAQNSDARVTAAEGKATAALNKIDVNSINKDDDGNWTASTLGAPQVRVPIAPPKWATPKPKGEPTKYEEFVAASNDPSRTPEERDAYAKTASRLEGKERRLAGAAAPRASAEEIRYNRWEKAFQQDNGRKPNAKEIEDFGTGRGRSGGGSKMLTPGQRSQIEKDKDGTIAKAKAEYDAVGDDPGAKEEYLDKWQAAQDEYENRLRDAGDDPGHFDVRKNVDTKGQTKSGTGNQQPQPKQPPQQQAGQSVQTKSGKQVKVGDTVMVNNQPHKVVGINPKTNKPIVAP